MSGRALARALRRQLRRQPRTTAEWEAPAPTPRGPVGRYGGRQIPVAPEIGTPEWDEALSVARTKQQRGERLTPQERWMLSVQ